MKSILYRYKNMKNLLLICLFASMALAVQAMKDVGPALPSSEPFFYIINDTPYNLHLRVRTGCTADIKRLFPLCHNQLMLNKDRFRISLSLKPEGGRDILPGTEKNPETFLFPARAIFKVERKQINAPLRIRLWTTHYYPAVDVKEGKPCETSEKNELATVLKKAFTSNDLANCNVFVVEKAASNRFTSSTYRDIPLNILQSEGYMYIPAMCEQYSINDVIADPA
jgi:hypothetical protein